MDFPLVCVTLLHSFAKQFVIKLYFTDILPITTTFCGCCHCLAHAEKLYLVGKFTWHGMQYNKIFPLHTSLLTVTNKKYKIIKIYKVTERFCYFVLVLIIISI